MKDWTHRDWLYVQKVKLKSTFICKYYYSISEHSKKHEAAPAAEEYNACKDWLKK